jgi:glutamate synthase domain-containing protein 1
LRPRIRPYRPPSPKQPNSPTISCPAPPRAAEGAEPEEPTITPVDSRAARGLYDPTYERDACGVAFVARLGAPASHEVISRALWALEHLEHRGAEGADPDTGDGAGILLQVPDDFLRAQVSFELPEPGRYGVAACFLPRRDEAARAEAITVIERRVETEGQRVLGWRDVPVDELHSGTTAKACAPYIQQLFVGAGDHIEDQDAFERKLYVIRRCVEKQDLPGVDIAGLSSRTLVYKGMLTAPQIS